MRIHGNTILGTVKITQQQIYNNCWKIMLEIKTKAKLGRWYESTLTKNKITAKHNILKMILSPNKKVQQEHRTFELSS